jgi:hypothetical protein
MTTTQSQDLNLDVAALEQFALHLAANVDAAVTSYAPFASHNSNNDNA